MPDSYVIQGSYVSQRIRWFRRWRIPLIVFSVIVWLPVLFVLQWKLHILSVLQQQGFYWLPGIDAPDLSVWHRLLLKFSYNLEYYTQILMRLLAVATAVALAGWYRPVTAGRAADKPRIYLDYRHAVRRAVYWAMLLFLLLPSLAARFVREAELTPEGIDLGTIGFPLILLVADWFSQCEFQQWLLLRFRRLGRGWVLGLTLLLAAAYFYANYYVPHTYHWGRLSVSEHYPDIIRAGLLGFSIITAILWRQHTVAPTAQMSAEIEQELARPRGSPASGDKSSGTEAPPRPWYRVPRRYIYYALSLLTLLGIALMLVKQSGVLHDPDIYPDPDLAIPVISTRGHYYYGELVSDFGKYEYKIEDPEQRLPQGTDEPGDLLVIIHGFNNGPLRAQYKFDLAQSSAQSCGYTGLIAGFSWDADTNHDPLSATGYSTGDAHAAQNGAQLAQFVTDFRDSNPNIRMHLVGYSMGARVALETAWVLANDERFAGDPLVVDSIHLLGASVDSEEVELGERYGAALQSRVGAVFNYFSRRDVALGAFYFIKEVDRSLGEMGIEHPGSRPANYHSVNAEAELITFDEQFQIVPGKTGDNHKGYLGAKDIAGNLLDDGAMNLILDNIAALPLPQDSHAAAAVSRRGFAAAA